MTAWLLLAGMWLCLGGLGVCAYAWARLPEPVAAPAAYRQRRGARVIFPPYDQATEVAG